ASHTPLLLSSTHIRRLTCSIFVLFFFNDTATTEIYTLSLHDALPICRRGATGRARGGRRQRRPAGATRTRLSAIPPTGPSGHLRSEEHTSELQSQSNLVCRLLLEKKKKKQKKTNQQKKQTTKKQYNKN